MAAYNDARQRKLKNYKRVATIDSVIDALAHKKPVVFGVTIYGDFLNLNSYSSTLVEPTTDDISLGGHAMCFVAYDKPNKLFKAKNSFGKRWGDEGYCYIPFDYITNYGYDMWVFDLDMM